MESVTTILYLLLAVVASGALSRASPVPLPPPIVQIALGALIAAVADRGIVLEPDIFFLLFLPPLLFLDGWRIPRGALVRDRLAIVGLASGLVVFTVFGLGFVIHLMIPAMPLAVAFALAAILSPTDPVAVSAIAARVPIPKRLMQILEGEALFNDASGLVCMRFAVAAALTGTFSLAEAFGTFVWVATVGIAAGVAVTWIIIWAKGWISHRFGEQTSSQILVSILIPFGAYLAAERLHASGILAAVAAGITMSYAEQFGRALAVTRVRRDTVWDTIQFAANGVIFVLLGEQFPKIADGAARVIQEAGHHRAGLLFFYVLSISAALIALRFTWVWLTLRLTLFRAARAKRPMQGPDWRVIAATSFAGVRGAITLAGILTLPLATHDGSPFPARDLAIFLAAGTIVVSLVAASVALPFLFQGLKLPPEPSHQKEEDRARVAAAKAAIERIDGMQHELGEGREDADIYANAGSHIMAVYRRRIDSRSKTENDAELMRKIDGIERELRLAGLHAEREEVLRLGRAGRIPEESVRKLVREIDMAEARLSPG
ncbi:MAG TPA: Na+/H+ antiporter [Rhizobiaceae bacterium]|nr:Na+/H+ antiporter [Rhizobiaceae bacterium]